jgi:hypothetical protein
MPERIQRKASTITIPWDRGSQTFERDMLATAILLDMDRPTDPRGVVDQLVSEYGLSRTDAMYYLAGARVCVRDGIEP